MIDRSPSENIPHIPVMLDEVLSCLPENPAYIVDGTFGAGGYSRAILDHCPNSKLCAIDRDPDVHPIAKALEQENSRFSFVQGCFGDMQDILEQAGFIDAKIDINIDAGGKIDAIILDIGVSSMQIDQAERGFSFRFEGRLDMRMAQTGQSAAEIVNQTDETELANIIYRYGEERQSRRIARAIVHARKQAPIETTTQLAEIIRSAAPQRGGNKKNKIDPSTRTFQALRIFVNDELGELERALHAAEKLLAPQGRLIVVTFHSLEDSIVKNFFKQRSGQSSGGSRYLPEISTPFNSPTAGHQANKPSFELPRPRYLTATPAEISRNTRARSAKLRYATRTDAPAWKEAA